MVHFKVRLQDVFLRNDVYLFEPLWTAITDSKALYPVLWSLYPNHPNLLYSKWQVDNHLKAYGYAQKPIDGRGGHNIKLVSKSDEAL